jgi:hypothetical protein
MAQQILSSQQSNKSRPHTSQTDEISLDMFNMVDEGVSSQASHQKLENKINRNA